MNKSASSSKLRSSTRKGLRMAILIVSLKLENHKLKTLSRMASTQEFSRSMIKLLDMSTRWQVIRSSIREVR